jgi:hypothetical protein
MTRTSNRSDLEDIRRRLVRSMSPLDEHRFAFESIFSAEPQTLARVPSVVVRVQLRGCVKDALYHWEVRVDHHLPLGASAAQAKQYATWLSRAAQKARWAEDLTRDHAWAPEQLRTEDPT